MSVNIATVLISLDIARGLGIDIKYGYYDGDALLSLNGHYVFCLSEIQQFIAGYKSAKEAQS